jgi:hypothetical protein
MAGVRIKINDPGLKITEEKIRQVGPHLLDEAVKLGIREAKEGAPVLTGDLRSSIRLMTKTRTSAVYGSDKPYAAVQEYGHGGIRPKRAKVLAFKVDGQWVFTKYVRPYKGKKYMARSAEKVRKSLPELLKRAMRRAGL